MITAMIDGHPVRKAVTTNAGADEPGQRAEGVQPVDDVGQGYEAFARNQAGRRGRHAYILAAVVNRRLFSRSKISRTPRGGSCRGPFSATSRAAWRPTHRCRANLAACGRARLRAARAGRHVRRARRRRRSSAAPTTRRSASRRWAAPRCRPTSGDLVLARAAAQANIPMIMSGAVAHAARGDAQARAPPPGSRPTFRATTETIAPLVERVARAGYDTLVVTVDVQVAVQPREQRPQPASARRCVRRCASPGTASMRPRWLVRHVPAHAAHARHAALREHAAPRRAAHLAQRASATSGDATSCRWKHIELIRRLWKGKLVREGHPRPGRRAHRPRERRRRHHRVEPRRPPARRRGRAAARAAGHRRRSRRHDR